MRLSIETITPAKAKKYLETNLHNQRNVSSTHVSKLAEMMRAGEFDGLNGETIKFNGQKEHEALIDGQHRLRAIVESNCKVKTAVLRGCSSKAFQTIDNSQNNRTVANYYEIYNQSHSKIAAQVGKWLYGYKQDNHRAVRGQLIRVKTAGFIADWAIDNHPDIPVTIDEIGSYLNAFNKAGLGTKSHLAFAYYLMRECDQLLAYDVARFLGSGGESPAPVFTHLKQVLMEYSHEAMKGSRVPGNIRFMQVVGAILVAWNSYRKGAPLRGTTGIKRVVTRTVTNRLPGCL